MQQAQTCSLKLRMDLGIMFGIQAQCMSQQVSSACLTLELRAHVPSPWASGAFPKINTFTLSFVIMFKKFWKKN